MPRKRQRSRSPARTRKSQRKRDSSVPLDSEQTTTTIEHSSHSNEIVVPISRISSNDDLTNNFQSLNNTFHTHRNRNRIRRNQQTSSINQQSYFSEIVLISLFFSSLILLFVVYSSFPSIPSEETASFKVPSTFQDLLSLHKILFEDMKLLGKILSKYADKHFFHVVFAYCVTFVFLQTFSIPGSIFLSVIGGRIFGFVLGVLMVCLLSTVGACLCFLLSFYIGRNLVKRVFPHKLALFGEQLSRYRSSLPNYLLFLRITPIVPNWFINISAPIFDVPLKTFALATFFGIIPATSITVHAGRSLEYVESPQDVLGPRALIFLFVFAFSAFLPSWKPFQQLMARVLRLN